MRCNSPHIPKISPFADVVDDSVLKYLGNDEVSLTKNTSNEINPNIEPLNTIVDLRGSTVYLGNANNKN